MAKNIKPNLIIMNKSDHSIVQKLILELEQVKKMQLELKTQTRVDENKHQQSSNHRQEVNQLEKDRK
jgi:hypothetical protein